jgi:serine/threonine-protein phosphatase 2A activator
MDSPKEYEYSEPVKRIYDSESLRLFHSSAALHELQSALADITRLVRGLQVPQGVLSVKDLYTSQEIEKYSHDLNVPAFEGNRDHMVMKPDVEAVVKLLKELERYADEIEPFPGPRRYGNMACRDWHTRVESQIDALMNKHIGPLYKKSNRQGFLKEVQWYFLNSFGSKERLDYGTGHELNFLAFLAGLWKTQVISSDADGYDFLAMFGHYYSLVRKLIIRYTLEPAGSHGVWGLDDHFHLIYILGASQLLDDPGHHLSPKYVNNRSVVYQYCTKNLYINAIAFIYKVKKGPFFEHSPILYDVSNIKTWEKILKGMIKMYDAEVFGKFPVIQHFYFGGVLFSWVNVKDGSALPTMSNEENIDQLKKGISDDWKEKVRYNPPITAAPWKKTSSLEEDLVNQSVGWGSTRAPVTGQQGPSVTRAPWPK